MLLWFGRYLDEGKDVTLLKAQHALDSGRLMGRV